MTLSVGDRIIVTDSTTAIECRVQAVISWRGILVATNTGQLYLEVVFNISATSWMRIVKLKPDITELSPNDLDELLHRIAHAPKRKTLNDIPEAEGFCPKDMRLKAMG